MLNGTVLNMSLYCCILYSFDNSRGIPEPADLLKKSRTCFPDSVDAKTQTSAISPALTLVNPQQCADYFRNEKCSRSTDIQYIFYTVFWLAVMLVAFFGNLIVLLSFHRSWTLKKTITNYFIASLALSDVLVSLFIVPVKIYQTSHNMRFCGTLSACRYYTTIDTVCFIASITNLFVISIDRFFAVEFPYKYSEYLTVRRVKFIICAIWIYSCVWGVPLHFHWGGHSGGAVEILDETLECVIQNRYYVIIVYGLVFYLPVAVMGVIYGRVFQITLRHARNISKTERDLRLNEVDSPTVSRCLDAAAKVSTSIQSSTHDKATPSNSPNEDLGFSPTPVYLSTPSSPCLPPRQRPLKRGSKLIQKVTKTVLMIYGLFLACWLPVSVLSIGLKWYPDLFRSSYASVWAHIVFVDVLPLFNSTCNPFIYALMNKQYRRAFRSILLEIFSRIPLMTKFIQNKTQQNGNRNLTRDQQLSRPTKIILVNNESIKI